MYKNHEGTNSNATTTCNCISQLNMQCFISSEINTPTLFRPAGDLLIVLAQVIVSVQMVLEEKFVYKHDVHPLRAVGTEGKMLFTNKSYL